MARKANRTMDLQVEAPPARNHDRPLIPTGRREISVLLALVIVSSLIAAVLSTAIVFGMA